MAGTELKERLAHVAGRISRISGQLDALRDQLDEDRGELEQAAPAPAPAGAAAPGQLELEYVNEALRKLLYGESQEEILDIYLEEAQSFVQRAILFLQRDGRYVTWKSYGFDPESIRDIALQDPSDAIVRSAHQRQLIYRRDHPTDSMPWLAQTGNLPRATFCIPLVFDNAVPVVFYGDSDDSIAIDSLELLTHLTVLVLKNNYLQQALAGEATALAGVAAPTPPEMEAEPQETQEAAEEAVTEAALEPEPDAQPLEEERAGQDDYQEVAETSVEQASSGPQPDADTVAWGVLEEEAEEAAEEPELESSPEEVAEEALDEHLQVPVEEEGDDDFDFELPGEEEVRFEIDLDTTPEVEEVMSQAAQESEQEVAEAEPPEDEARELEAQEEEAAPAEEPSFEVPPEPRFEEPVQFEPQPEPEPEHEAEPEPEPQAEAEPEPVSSLSSEEEKKVHDDARRFARLLVSEIKLYNEEQVENGRVNADLYERLTRDVDRSRDMYNKRVHPEVARAVDYFHEELVRILAKGDESLLGDSYPGAQF